MNNQFKKGQWVRVIKTGRVGVIVYAHPRGIFFTVQLEKYCECFYPEQIEIIY